RELAALAGHDYIVNDLAFLPDGTHVVSGSRDFTVRVWDLTDRFTYRASNVARSADVHLRRWSQDGSVVAWSRHDEKRGTGGGVVVADSKDGRVLMEVDEKVDVLDIMFSADGRRAAVHMKGGGEVRDVRTGAKLCDLSQNDDPKEGGHQSFWSADGRRVAV